MKFLEFLKSCSTKVQIGGSLISWNASASIPRWSTIDCQIDTTLLRALCAFAPLLYKPSTHTLFLSLPPFLSTLVFSLFCSNLVSLFSILIPTRVSWVSCLADKMASSPTIPLPPCISEEELEDELTDVGNKLLKPPFSTEELLKLLDVRALFPVFCHKDLIFMVCPFWGYWFCWSDCYLFLIFRRIVVGFFNWLFLA